MKPTSSLSGRIQRLFTVIFFSFSIISMIFILLTARMLEDHAIEQQFSQIVAKLKNEGVDSRSFLPQIAVYYALDELPSEFLSPVHALKPGIHEVHFGEAEFYYAFEILPDNTEFIVTYDISDIELSERDEMLLYLAFIAFYLGLMLLTWLVLRSWLNRALRPLRQLSTEVKQAAKTPGCPVVLNSEHWVDDEVGLLGNTIRELTERIRDFVERERDFTRFASHELRTPLTVIKGAVEVLNMQTRDLPGGPPQVVGRIARSSEQMEVLIELFLTLAREDATTSVIQMAMLDDAYRHAVRDTMASLTAKQPSIEEQGSLAAGIFVARTHAEIVLINLLRNAVIHSPDATVQVTLEPDRITIVNRVGRGSDDRELPRHQIGLRIVERITEQQGWAFSFEINEDKSLATASVIFPREIMPVVSGGGH